MLELKQVKIERFEALKGKFAKDIERELEEGELAYIVDDMKGNITYFKNMANAEKYLDILIKKGSKNGLTKSQQLKLIDNAFRCIKEVLENIHIGEYHNQYYNLNKAEEKDHDRCRPSSISRGISISEAVKLFYVLHIVRSLSGDKNYTIKDYIHIRKSVLMAQSLVENYKDELKKALNGFSYHDILNIDYAELQKTESEVNND